MKRGLLFSLLLSAALLLSSCAASDVSDDAQTTLPENGAPEETGTLSDTPDDEKAKDERLYLDDVLGFPGYAVTVETMDDSWKTVDYYAIVDGEDIPVAESWGFGDEPYSKTVSFDLDGDGRSELISFCTYNADGAERVFAHRWNGEASEEGYPNWGRAGVELSGIGEIHWQESYDAERGVIELRYRGGSDDDYRTAELPLTMDSFHWST